jgi:LmeA-like phospholipid-binding
VIALGVLALLVILLVGSQLLLPGVAEQRVRERVGRYGSVRSVHVSALPAIEMLWGKVDSMDVNTGRLRIALDQMTNMVWSARHVDELNLSSTGVDLTGGSLTSSGLLLRNVSFHKHGASLSGAGTLSESDLRAALPEGFAVQPVASGNGEIQVKASVPIFGVESSIEGIVSAQAGKLVVQPTDIPFANLATLTLFSDPRISVQGVSATQRSGGYDLQIDARLR